MINDEFANQMLQRKDTECGPYRVLTADPAWPSPFEVPYSVMTVKQICEMRLPPLADDCYLFLWRLSQMVEEAYQVVRAWGFKPRSEMVWVKRTVRDKRRMGMGNPVRNEHESIIIATRGNPKRRRNNIYSTFAAKVGRHSEKPASFYYLVEELCEGPYAEMFARRHRPGWHCEGLEL